MGNLISLSVFNTYCSDVPPTTTLAARSPRKRCCTLLFDGAGNIQILVQLDIREMGTRMNCVGKINSIYLNCPPSWTQKAV